MSSAFSGTNPLPLAHVGPYQLVTELEPGTLGPLWAARSTAGSEEGRAVLLRRVSTAGTTPEQTAQVVEAAGVARNLRHSKLAAVLDLVVTAGEIAIVGEHVAGPTLALLQRLAYTKETPLPPAVALRLGVDLLHALRAARDGWNKLAPPALRGKSHGGLTPDHVLIAEFGEVLLGEVGVAAVAGALEPFRARPGVAAYRAPEQLTAEPAAERADVFSVGVVLWELLANRPLFGDEGRLLAPGAAAEGGVARAVQDLQSKLIPALPSRTRDGAPIARAAVDIVERALRRDPGTRFATIDQMLGALLALGRDVVASSDQVVPAIDRLARGEFESRRAVLGPSSIRPSARPSAVPDSGRPTHRPDLPGSSSGARFEQQAPGVEQFSQHEAPTFPTASLTRPVPAVRSKPPPAPVRSKQPPPPVRSKPPPAPVRSKPPPGPEPPKPPQPSPGASTDAPAAGFGTPLPPLPEVADLAPVNAAPAPAPVSHFAPAIARPAATSRRQQRARRIALLIGGGVGVIALMAILRALIGGAKTEVTVPSAAPVERAAAPQTRVTAAASPLPTAAPAVAASAQPETKPAQPAPSKPAERSEPPRAEPARGAPAPDEPRRPGSRPEPPKKTFRPKGI